MMPGSYRSEGQCQMLLEGDRPSPQLKSFLTALWRYIKQMGPSDDTDCSPAKLKHFLRAAAANRDLDSLTGLSFQHLRDFYTKHGIAYSLVPDSSRDGVEPEIPVLTDKGFIDLFALFIRVFPRNLQVILSYACKILPAKDSEAITTASGELPMSLFPELDERSTRRTVEEFRSTAFSLPTAPYPPSPQPRRSRRDAVHSHSHCRHDRREDSDSDDARSSGIINFSNDSDASDEESAKSYRRKRAQHIARGSSIDHDYSRERLHERREMEMRHERGQKENRRSRDTRFNSSLTGVDMERTRRPIEMPLNTPFSRERDSGRRESLKYDGAYAGPVQPPIDMYTGMPKYATTYLSDDEDRGYYGRRGSAAEMDERRRIYANDSDFED